MTKTFQELREQYLALDDCVVSIRGARAGGRSVDSIMEEMKRYHKAKLILVQQMCAIPVSDRRSTDRLCYVSNKVLDLIAHIHLKGALDGDVGHIKATLSSFDYAGCFAKADQMRWEKNKGE